ncbi:uncharacterized protein PV09_07363 [Verruconis gallopava]|uniref:Uncharacterized protein n=1 Tax=Verruconis gallopava TaxID=253628 RepID=A0A0D1YJP5_9PEZI|nr:uncharacterized protein PV09_07363 [Verruconis gallopava]KIW01072.1 hypothetical protein PV09_07363 [Verruconis gallopava]
MPYGRGGAGNIEAANQKQIDDLEAQRSRGEPRPVEPAESSKSSSIASPANLNQEYAHMGRGGAGNWYSPKDLSQTGKFDTSPEQLSSESRSIDKDATSESRHRGRGGAGNFIWSSEEETNVEKRRKEVEIELKEMVAKGVEAELAPPPRAFIRQWNEY